MASMSSVLGTIFGHSRSEPLRPAVKDGTRELDYGTLLEEVGHYADGLSSRGVKPGDRVGILMSNSVDFVIVALACLMTDAIFVPLSPSDPTVRLVTIIADCNPNFVVVNETTAAVSSTLGVEKISILNLRSSSPVSTHELTDSSQGSYIIYTSGTTGSPKGVLIGNAAFSAALSSTVEALGLSRSTRTLCISPFHFDGSFGTLFATLFAGGSVVIRPRDELLFPRAFFNTVAKEQITYTGFSPSYLRLLLSSPQVDRLRDSSLEIVALGGEAAIAADVLSLWSKAPQLKIFNRYGPTETTIAVTHAHLSKEMVARGTVSIGRPHPNVRFHLLSEDRVVVEGADQSGELYIAGIQLMDGYWGDDNLSAEVLRRDIVPNELVYRTGDLVYRDTNDEYFYVDRLDRVVKRSGVRISLVELGESIRHAAHVNAAVCVMFDNHDEPGIVAFVVSDADVDVGDVMSGLKKLLPESMLPNRVMFVDALPMTNSGKLDERKLLRDAGLRQPGTGSEASPKSE